MEQNNERISNLYCILLAILHIWQHTNFVLPYHHKTHEDKSFVERRDTILSPEVIGENNTEWLHQSHPINLDKPMFHDESDNSNNQIVMDCFGIFDRYRKDSIDN